MKFTEEDKVIYAICESDIQEEAERRIGRKLNEDELHSAIKGIECTIDWQRDEMYNNVFSNIDFAENKNTGT